MPKIRLDKNIALRGPRGFTEWLRPARMSKHLIGCCDCGLVHEFQFKIVTIGKRQTVIYRARRAARYTAKQRKQKLRCHCDD